MIIYVGTVMGILYYLGITQVIAAKLALVFEYTMGTTAIETLGATANIFLNGVSKSSICIIVVKFEKNS